MRSRLSLYLNDLSLEEILYLDEELDRRKEKYRKHYAVLSVQTDPPVLRSDNNLPLAQLSRDLRRFMGECSAVGGGTVLAYTPEVCVMLFHSVESASQSCSALLAALPELNGRSGKQSYRVGLKLGLASGTDTLAPGSARCVRKSPLVKRANQCSWRSASGSLMMDENSYHEWPMKYSAVRVPAEIDGHHIYRVVPGLMSKESNEYDNEALNQFLQTAGKAGIQLLKYGANRVDPGSLNITSWGTPMEMLELLMEAYDTRMGRNLVYTERIAVGDFPNRMEAIKRQLSQAGIALMRQESSAIVGG
jgi:hypothetical protein